MVDFLALQTIECGIDTPGGLVPDGRKADQRAVPFSSEDAGRNAIRSRRR
jgi:hypothetical protein